MTNETIELKAKIYVYDLNNCAIENGFKADETWEFSMATDQEKTALEKKIFPNYICQSSARIFIRNVSPGKGETGTC